MSLICPTVLASEAHDYRQQMEKVEKLTSRIQIDLMDGDFASPRSIEVDQVWWPEDISADIHLMYKNPADVLNEVLELKPRMVVIHAEADVDVATFAGALKVSEIKFGLAFLKDTNPQDYLEELEYADHVLIFSGDLGKFGGTADMSLLRKVQQIKKYKPNVEIGWDGGVNSENTKALSDGGVDVLNVGGFIQNSDDPVKAYNELLLLVQS